MKRIFVIFLVFSLTLTGCSIAVPVPTERSAASSAAPAAEERHVIEKTTAAAFEEPPMSMPEVRKESLPSAEAEVTQTQAPEKEPQEAPDSLAEDPLEPAMQTEVPTSATVSETEGSSASAPTQSTPQQTTSSQDDALTDPFQIPMFPLQDTPDPKPQQKPVSSVPGRAVSSATCMDTGSDEIWPDPAADAPDYYEETDPDRIGYLQYLQEEGNMYYYWIREEDMRMYLGRDYGIPLYTSYDMMVESTWSSSDTSVATVNQVGYVVPQKEGTAVVTVTYVDPESLESCSRQCSITVQPEPAPDTYAQLEQRAHEEAKLIADYVMNNGTLTTDLERIAMAAAFINAYVAAGTSTSSVPGYNQPFGTLVSFYSSCAGSTRAMGLVLEYMGFEWYHVNENQWSHQWCVVYDVDGQTAFADGSVYGIAGYGPRQEDGSNWMQYRNGTVVPF